MEYYYLIAGLTFKSEIELSGLVTSTADSYDVLIVEGDIPDTTEEYKALALDTFHAPDKLVQHIRNICSFYVEAGNKIVVRKTDKAGNQDIKTFFIDLILPYLLYYRGFSLVRASGVMVNEQLIMLIGISASFKSTIAGALAQLGYDLVGDDLIVFNPHGGSLDIIPTMLPIQLWEDACKSLALDINKLTRVRSVLYRYEVPFKHAQTTPFKTGIMYRLNSQNEPSNKIDAVEGIVKLNSIINNNFCYPFLKATNQEKYNLKTSAELAKRVKFRDLCVGLNSHPHVVAKLILEDIVSCTK